ncbi:hypothetical protein QUF76_17555 [Desulfobacterales bacterium HSG16]|nr:hypothetical protein [Desulfobacterales bacterium HSG16]
MVRRLNGTKTVGYVSLHILTHYFSPLSAALFASSVVFFCKTVKQSMLVRLQLSIGGVLTPGTDIELENLAEDEKSIGYWQYPKKNNSKA